MRKKLIGRLVGLCLAAGTSIALAGPVIIDGTDAEEHGSFNGTVNINGWEYFQRGFENLLPQVGNSNTIAVCLGCTGNTQAAFASAFDLAAKPAGWTRQTVDGDANITSYFAGTLAGVSLTNTGLIYIPTGGNTAGGITAAELAVINANALAINTFVGGAGNATQGGGLFAHGEGATVGAWGWLTTLIPGIVATESGGGNNLELTAAGIAAFPGLTNGDVNAGTPWHNHFSGNLGGLQVLVQTTNGPAGRAVVIGGGAGTIIQCGAPGQPPCPTSVPEPGGMALIAAALAAAALAGRQRRRQT
jgi:MYXO-CTERM domain-containing protein